MYRYQALFEDSDSSEMTNWICFGTTNNCGTNDDNIDKYMYRIIGITPNGELYLIKETFLKEGETTGFKWNTMWQLSDCLGDKCEWPNADLFKRLNGETSNGNPIFVDSTEYEYMAQGTNWYNLIEEHTWMYGDTNTITDSIRYNGNEMYGIETGKTTTKRIWLYEGQEICSSDNPCTEKDYTWSKSTNAKIGLMYMHDIDYAYPGGNPESTTNVKNSWIYFQKDEYNTSLTYEWLITRLGIYKSSFTHVHARSMDSSRGLGTSEGVAFLCGARPVFYLSSKAKIVDGDGTKAKPYILDVKE